MKSKTLIQILLGIVIIGLAVALYMSMTKPIKFNNEFTKRRDACAEKLKAIRTLEEAYKNTYGCYTGSFDTLFNRLMNEDSLRVVNKNINYDKIPEDVDINELSETEQINAGYVSRVTEYVMPVFECLVNMEDLLADLDHQLVVNKIDELIKNQRFPGWKVGDMTQTITDGNFE